MKMKLWLGDLAISLITNPGIALAVGASSSDGYGDQYVQSWTGAGANLTGWLNSTQGDPVYFQGAATTIGGTPGAFSRYTGNVSDATYRPVGGWAGGGEAWVTGVAFKVCKDMWILPDPCGDFSTIRS